MSTPENDPKATSEEQPKEATPEQQPESTNATAAAKKKKKKKKTTGAGAAAAESEVSSALAPAPAPSSAGATSGLESKLSLMALMSGFRADRNIQTVNKEAHAFWRTQPVPSGEQLAALERAMKEREGKEGKVGDGPHGPLEVKKVSDVRPDPYPLPPAFKWESIDMSDPKSVSEVYELLNGHYVEDDDAQFRFDYSKEFLQWALQPPGFIRDWCVGVRETGGKQRLMGFITGIPVKVRVYDSVVEMAEINFLCVHKSLRNKRLAPVLIKEITRRVNLTDRWQAVYTAGVVIPTPLSQTRYYHRSLNPKKLIEVGFSRLAPRMTMARTIKLYQLPKDPLTPGLRPLEEKDCKQAYELLTNYLKKFQLVQIYTLEEFKHWFIPRPNIINTYVVEDPQTGKITDMISFYTLNSSVIKNDKYPTLRAAYSFYNVSTKTPLVDLMQDALILARNLGFDVFNALDVMDNEPIFKPLKFGIGDGHLQYYLYNWQCPRMLPHQIGMVLM